MTDATLDRVEGLGDAVPVDGCVVRFERASIGDMDVRALAGPRSRAVTEIGLEPFLLAAADGGSPGWVRGIVVMVLVGLGSVVLLVGGDLCRIVIEETVS